MQYKVTAYRVTGLKSKVYLWGETVDESYFPKGTIEGLVKSNSIAPIEETKKEAVKVEVPKEATKKATKPAKSSVTKK